MPLGRRRYLELVAGSVVALAGCSAGDDGSTGTSTYLPPDVVVFNDTGESRTATVTVALESREEPVVDETTTIEARDAAEYRDPLPASGSVTLRVAVEGGPSGERGFSVADEEESVQAVIGGEAIEFRKR